jgi:protein tyrosine/serine phosphatase
MRAVFRAVFLSALFFFSVAAPVAPDTKSGRDRDIPNFHRVHQHLYRGGQPGPEGIRKLAGMGIRTLVDLRDDDDRARAEERKARSHGLRYFNVPLSGFRRPRMEAIEKVLRLIAHPENQPVFVHCKRGADRTGVAMACERVAHDGWSQQRAAEEARSLGLGWWQVRMKGAIRSCPVRMPHGSPNPG